MPSDMLIFPEDEQWGDLPDDFLDDTDDDYTIGRLKDIRKAVNRPLIDLISTLDKIVERNELQFMRGIRFASGAEALIWLFEKGIFLFSQVVQMGDGTWGLMIKNSDPALSDDMGETDNDIVF